VAAIASGAITVLAVCVSSWLFIHTGQTHDGDFDWLGISLLAGFVTILCLFQSRVPTHFTASGSGLIVHSPHRSVSYSWDQVEEISVSNPRLSRSGVVVSCEKDGKAFRKKFRALDGRNEELARRLREWRTSYLASHKSQG
jgi:hypothetical protein